MLGHATASHIAPFAFSDEACQLLIEIDAASKIDHNTGTDKNNFVSATIKGNQTMATAKKPAPKATARPKAKTPVPVAKPAAKSAAKKAPLSMPAKAIEKISSSIAKLTERKDKLNAEINALRAQRTELKAASAPVATPAVVVPRGKAAPKVAPKVAAPTKGIKRATKK